jgi:uncharacterized membrane protein YdjX (TVP38/TMEM64 family)
MGMEKPAKPIYLLFIPVVLTILLSLTLQSTVVNNQQIYVNWLSSFGGWFILVYIIIQVLGIVIAPIGGFFIQVGLFAILPPVQALLLIYAVTTPAFFINFFLARRFGKPIVTKLIGNTAMDTVNTYADEIGPIMLVVIKLFQGGIFDYLSYAAGLTNIKPVIFFLVNVFGGLPGILVSYFILTRFTNFTVSIMVLIFTGYIMFGLAMLFIHFRRKRQTIITVNPEIKSEVSSKLKASKINKIVS